jgi:hypothetical protein
MIKRSREWMYIGPLFYYNKKFFALFFVINYTLKYTKNANTFTAFRYVGFYFTFIINNIFITLFSP